MAAITLSTDMQLAPLVISVDKLTITYNSPPATPLPSIHDLMQPGGRSPVLSHASVTVPPLWRAWTPTSAPSSTTVIPMSPLALEAGMALKKATSTKIARRSLWKCRRRPLSMQDLLCVDSSRSRQREHKAQASHRRQCGIHDCYKYALSGGFCISHGGGKPCRQHGCNTVAQSGGLCKAHGGGSKCKTPGCSSVARRKGFCMTHGGRQPCKVEGCDKCAHGGGFCIAHGGGKRCSTSGCTKSAQAGGFCYSHGGGKRCSAPQCFQAARKGGRCIRHRATASYADASAD